jgi:hypothetical protein
MEEQTGGVLSGAEVGKVFSSKKLKGQKPCVLRNSGVNGT